MQLTLSDLVQAPFFSYKYQGKMKYITKDCPDCPWYFVLTDKDRRCYGGKYWQYVTDRAPWVQQKKPVKCALLGKSENISEETKVRKVMAAYVAELRQRLADGQIDLSNDDVANTNRTFEWDCQDNRWRLRLELRLNYGRFVLTENDPLRALFGEEIFKDLQWTAETIQILAEREMKRNTY